MGFTNDELLLNDINLDSIADYKKYLDQLRPILMEESGFKEITKATPLGIRFEDYQKTVEQGYSAGLSETEIANKLGVSRDEFKTLDQFRIKAGGLYNQAESYAAQARSSSNPSQKAALEAQAQSLYEQANAARTELQTTTFNRTSLEKTAERKALEDRYKKLEDEQLKLTELQSKRQQDAIQGKIETSPILQKQIQDEFNAFKESQARAGNIILGEDPFTAVGKGTAAENSLARFQDNAKAAKQREIESIVNQTPLYYQGLGISSGIGSPSQPGFPDISGVSQLSLSGQQPFQFNRQLEFQREQMMNQNTQNRKNRQSQLLGGGLQLAATLPFMFAGPAGAAGAGSRMFPGQQLLY